MRTTSQALRTRRRRGTVAQAAAAVLALAFLSGALPLAAQPASEAAPPPSDRPNILFLFEHSMRCPLIIRGPGIPQGSTEAFTYLHDLFPTLLGLASAQTPPGIDGRDLAALWSGDGETAWRQGLFLPYRDLMRSVRDERYKLIVYLRVNHRQLFDLADDPDELRNLAADPAHGQTLARMEALLEGWRAALADPAPLATAAPSPLRRDLTGQAREPDRWQPQWIVDKYFDPPASREPD